MLSRSNSPRLVSTTPCPSAPVFPFQHDDGFYVVGVGEHVHRPDGAHLVAALHQLARVAGLGCGVARDVDDAPGRQRGYAVRTVQPVDMFPHTDHIETIALVERVEGFFERSDR